MRIRIQRKPNRFYPDPARTILRFFNPGEERVKEIIKLVVNMSQSETEAFMNIVLSKFAIRHRNITKTLEMNYERVKHLLPKPGLNSNKISAHKKLLMGSYFTMEYSMESAAFFNPSIVEAPNQYGLIEGKRRIILSFRAIGEGHISSIVFRTGLIDRECNFEFMPAGDRIEEASIIKHHTYDRKEFRQKLKEMNVSRELSTLVFKDLSNEFHYPDLRRAIETFSQKNELTHENQIHLKEIKWLADSYYEIHFSLDTDITERVIFPVSDSERNGIEDARFVKFIDNGQSIYYATYTAYNGHTVLPKLLVTKDFYNFNIRPIHGEAAQGKNLALFPKKINGKYAMLSRIDGVNTYITFSDHLTIWENPLKIQTPRYPWEFVKIGNCGSPLETESGWLVITHGVGPMRTYCLGASLFELNDPTKELGRLSEPLLIPKAEEMEGYVPNVVYSCGAIIQHAQVVIPYGMSDFGSGILTVPLDELLNKIVNT